MIGVDWYSSFHSIISLTLSDKMPAMKIEDILKVLENFASPSLQEDYDNAGLITGNSQWECTGVLVSLDATERVLEEAAQQKCNLVISHHPIIFKGLKKINGNNYVERTVIYAIKNDIAVYAIHTNLDNILEGVNERIAAQLGLIRTRILKPKSSLLRKLAVFVPGDQHEQLLEELFLAGAGNIGKYRECSFRLEGIGSFTPGDGSKPYSGEINKRSIENEVKIEVIYPYWKESQILSAMFKNHPYEEVAHDIYILQNSYQETGSGLIGELKTSISENELLSLLQVRFGTSCIKHTKLRGKMVKNIALCGGAGSSLLANAINLKADVYITSDLKYHEYFDADSRLLLADIGHYESEQFTVDLLFDLLRQKFLNFAVLKTSVQTNPVYYFTS